MLIENYDANGNMVKRGGSTISYSSYNLPTLINSGSNSSAISYGAYRNRYKQVAQSAEGTETTIYVAGLVEKVTRGGLVEYRHLIAGGQTVAAIHTRRSGGTPASDTVYVHTDHLGSPELFTNSSGGVVVRPSFGAYGERRDGSDWDGPVSAADLDKIADTIRHGFTGHEHLDAVGLIHMNGRVYDPLAGRFLGVDPIVHAGNSQSPNGYSYVWNNPLTFVDPSGFDHCDVTDINCHRNDPPANPFEPEPPFWDPRPDEPSERRFPSMAHAYIANADAILLPRDYRAELGQVMPTVDGTVGGPQGKSFTLGPITITWTYRDNFAGRLLQSGLAASIGVGISPAGVLADVYTAGTGTDYFTEEEVTGFWRWAGILPFVGELKKGGKVFDAARGVQAFEIHPRVLTQLADARLGSLAGRITPADLQRLANNPAARRVLDARSGNINVIQEVEGRLIRITVPRDAHRIISVGPIRANQVENLLRSGDFVPLP